MTGNNMAQNRIAFRPRLNQYVPGYVPRVEILSARGRFDFAHLARVLEARQRRDGGEDRGRPNDEHESAGASSLLEGMMWLAVTFLLITGISYWAGVL